MSRQLEDDVLVLNRVYLAVRVTTVRAAITLIFKGRAHGILADYSTHDFESWLALATEPEGSLGMVGGRSLRTPQVIVLRAYDGVPRFHVRFTRSNVLARDAHRCQYCGQDSGPERLTLDHVRPVSRGGLSQWDNVVTCCVPCNRRKADRSLDRTDMRLLRKPRRPRWHPLHEATRERTHPEVWKHFVDESILSWSPQQASA